MARSATRLLGGSGACSPEKILKNGAIWCVLEYILLQFCQKKLVKMFIFYIKIIDIVLLRTTFRGIGAYSRMFVGRVGPSPPPLERINVFFLIARGPSYSCGDLFPIFCYLSSCPWGRGEPFWACPPPYKNFCGHHVVGNFSCGALSWHYGHISYRYRSRGGGCLNEWSFIKG